MSLIFSFSVDCADGEFVILWTDLNLDLAPSFSFTCLLVVGEKVHSSEKARDAFLADPLPEEPPF